MKSKVTTLSILKEIKNILNVRLPVLTGAVAMKSGYLKLKFNPDRFEKLSDGWIKDNLLGIDWSPKSLEKRLEWQEAQEYTAKFGRQAEVDELDSLTDRSKRNLAIVEAAKVLELESDYYWSGTTYADNTGFAWIVYFNNGYVVSDNKGSGYYVRAVRSSQ